MIKAGGSLLDLPDLAPRLRTLLASLSPAGNVLLCGGGPLAAAVRRYDAVFQLPAEAAHWLAVRTMSLNAQLLGHLLPEIPLVTRLPPTPCPAVILDPLAMLQRDEPAAPGPRLPRDWSATSDSIAARIAHLLQARQLCLLKSVSAPARDLRQLAEQGVVDPDFPAQAAGLEVQLVNLRAQDPARRDESR